MTAQEGPPDSPTVQRGAPGALAGPGGPRETIIKAKRFCPIQAGVAQPGQRRQIQGLVLSGSSVQIRSPANLLPECLIKECVAGDRRKAATVAGSLAPQATECPQGKDDRSSSGMPPRR